MPFRIDGQKVLIILYLQERQYIEHLEMGI